MKKVSETEATTKKQKQLTKKEPTLTAPSTDKKADKVKLMKKADKKDEKESKKPNYCY